MEQKHKKRRKRSPVMAAMTASLLVLILLVTTMAMLSSQDIVKNTFNAGSLDITLIEPKWHPENAQGILPGDYLDKDPGVVSNEELDVYVFLKVSIPCDKLIIEDVSGNALTNGTADLPLFKLVSDDQKEADTNALQKYHDDVWKLLDDDNNGYTYYTPSTDDNCGEYVYVYAYLGGNAVTLRELQKDEQTSKPLFDKVYVSNFNENFNVKASRDYSVRVEAYGIQTRYLGDGGEPVNEPKAVWQKIISN